MDDSNSKYALITRLEKFARINSILTFEDTDDYVDYFIKPRRIILVTMARITSLITSLRFFLSAVIKKVIKKILTDL